MTQTVQIGAVAPAARQVYVEGSGFWGPDRVLVTRLERLGYRVAERRVMATGDVRLDVT